jgi:ubiquinone/menaquinone biosynthesis C-methylase UbiE
MDQIAMYDDVADRYHDAVDPDGTGARDATLEAMLGTITGCRVLSLACGQGRDARLLADLGATVVGVDVSERMLGYARALEESRPRGITYVHGSAHDLADLGDDTFDGVVCYMALMDVPDLPATLAAVARVLRPGGWFVATIVHPCFRPPNTGEVVDHVDGSVRRTVGGYFVEGPYDRVTRWEAIPRRSYHRMLSTYVNGFIAAGFTVVGLAEPVGAGEQPVWQEVPGLLYVRCVRSS